MRMPAARLLLLFLPPHRPPRRALGRQTRKALRIRGHRMRNRLRILDERVHVQIGHIIPSSVVIHIVRHARLAAKQRLLLRRLDALGACEESPSCNPRICERGIVAPSVERVRHPLQAGVVGEVILEQLFRFGGAWGAGDVEGGAIAVVDAVLVVWGSDHVEVKIEPDLRLFGVGEGGNVEFGAKETEFLGGHPDKADGVIDAVFGELDGDFEQADAARAVIVNTRALVGGKLAGDSRKMIDATRASGPGNNSSGRAFDT